MLCAPNQMNLHVKKERCSTIIGLPFIPTDSLRPQMSVHFVLGLLKVFTQKIGTYRPTRSLYAGVVLNLMMGSRSTLVKKFCFFPCPVLGNYTIPPPRSAVTRWLKFRLPSEPYHST